MGYLPRTYIKFDIANITESFTIPTINYFLFPEFTNAHIITHIYSWFIICASVENVYIIQYL